MVAKEHDRDLMSVIAAQVTDLRANFDNIRGDLADLKTSLAEVSSLRTVVDNNSKEIALLRTHVHEINNERQSDRVRLSSLEARLETRGRSR